MLYRDQYTNRLHILFIRVVSRVTNSLPAMLLTDRQCTKCSCIQYGMESEHVLIALNNAHWLLRILFFQVLPQTFSYYYEMKYINHTSFFETNSQTDNPLDSSYVITRILSIIFTKYKVNTTQILRPNKLNFKEAKPSHKYKPLSLARIKLSRRPNSESNYGTIRHCIN